MTIFKFVEKFFDYFKIVMYTSACMWDNDLVDRKEGQMKPIEITEQDQFGCDRTFAIRRDEACGKVFLAEIDPDFGFESFCGVFGSIEAALDRIEMPIYWKGTAMDIKRFTDEITALDTVRKRPCISEGGECHIVSSYTISTMASTSQSPIRSMSMFLPLRLRLTSGPDRWVVGVTIHAPCKGTPIAFVFIPSIGTTDTRRKETPWQR